MLSKLKELVKHSLAFGIGEFLTASVGIILIPLYTRVLDPNEYGALSLLLISFTFLNTVSLLGINSSLVRSYYDYDREEDRKRLVCTAAAVTLAGCLVLSGFFIIWSSLISQTIFSSTLYTKHLILLAVTNLFQSVNFIFLSLMRAKKQSLKYSIFNFTGFFTKTAFIILFVAFLKKGVLGVIYGGLYSVIINWVLLVFVSRKDIIFSIISTEVKKLLRFGLPLVFSNLAVVMMTSLDRFVIKYYLDLTDVGIYNLGYQIGTIVHIALVAPFGLIWPSLLLSVKDEDDAKEFYSRVMTYFVYIGSLLSLCIGLFSEEIISIIGTSKYQSAYTIVFPISISFVLMGIGKVIHVGISISRKTEYYLLIVALTALVNLGLNFLLVPRWGIMGAAAATVIATVFMVIFKHAIVKKIFYIQYDWNRIFRMSVVVISLYIASRFLTVSGMVNVIILKVFLISLFPVSLHYLGFYQKVEIETIKSILKKIYS